MSIIKTLFSSFLIAKPRSFLTKVSSLPLTSTSLTSSFGLNSLKFALLLSSSPQPKKANKVIIKTSKFFILSLKHIFLWQLLPLCLPRVFLKSRACRVNFYLLQGPALLLRCFYRLDKVLKQPK